MSGTYRFVKLLKNHIYPTYQLHAYMANDKTAPDAGLRLAALTTIHWLKSRLGDAAPKEWEGMLSPADYLSATDDDLPSLICNDRCQEAISPDSGFLRDLPTEGISKEPWNQISGIGHSDIRGFGGCRTSTLPTG